MQLFQGITNISMSFMKSKICSTQDATTPQDEILKSHRSWDLLALHETS